ncbi:MAG: HEPN domain-containing protein [Rickettsiaceae bacterium]|nr:HEPN domain-containing protein [Rickettsiaceae bacterium]
MKTDISHIPQHKQSFLQNVTNMILREAKKVNEEIAFIILYGSYARGDWVDDNVGGYYSDYDILVVPVNKIEYHPFLWHKIRENIAKWKLPYYKPTPQIIEHNIKFLNKKLQENEYFFIDIKKEGIILYDSGKYQLAEPKDFTLKERQAKAADNFDYWLQKASSFLPGVEFFIQKNELNKAAFLLHQATESFYATISLVYADYKKSTHNLAELESYINGLEPRFIKVFPKKNEEEKRLFELLRKAYVDSRYKRSYKITKEELTWLIDKVKLLEDLTIKCCEEKISSFTARTSSKNG